MGSDQGFVQSSPENSSAWRVQSLSASDDHSIALPGAVKTEGHLGLDLDFCFFQMGYVPTNFTGVGIAME